MTAHRDTRDQPGSAQTARWRVVIVDDETPAIKRIASLVADTDDFTVVATYTDSIDARLAIEAMQRDIEIDVLFLDIHMPGMTGLELAAALGDRAPAIVFTTAYDQHAVAAFEADAMDYLLKPIERPRFVRTLDRIRTRLRERARVDMHTHVAAMLRGLGAGASAAGSGPRVAIRTRERTTLVDPAHIDRVDADGNTLHVTAGRERYSFRETLASFAERLPAAQFVRVSRSTIVRIDRVRHVEPWLNGDYTLVLEGGSKTTTGRTYREQIRAALSLP